MWPILRWATVRFTAEKENKYMICHSFRPELFYTICFVILSISSMKTLSTSWSQSSPLDASLQPFWAADCKWESVWELQRLIWELGEIFCGGSTCPNEDWIMFWPISGGGVFSASSLRKAFSFESLLMVFEDAVFIPAVSDCLPFPLVLCSLSLQTLPYWPEPFLLTHILVGNTLPFLHKSMWNPKWKPTKERHRILWTGFSIWKATENFCFGLREDITTVFVLFCFVLFFSCPSSSIPTLVRQSWLIIHCDITSSQVIRP